MTLSAAFFIAFSLYAIIYGMGGIRPSHSPKFIKLSAILVGSLPIALMGIVLYEMLTGNPISESASAITVQVGGVLNSIGALMAFLHFLFTLKYREYLPYDSGEQQGDD